MAALQAAGNPSQIVLYPDTPHGFHADYRASYRQEQAQDGWKRLQHAVNEEFMQEERDQCLPRCFESGFQFLDLNRDADQWFMMLECFDPHEPFDAPARFKMKYETGWKDGVLDWPMYEKVTDSPEEIAEIRANYAAFMVPAVMPTARSR